MIANIHSSRYTNMLTTHQRKNYTLEHIIHPAARFSVWWCNLSAMSSTPDHSIHSLKIFVTGVNRYSQQTTRLFKNSDVLPVSEVTFASLDLL